MRKPKHQHQRVLIRSKDSWNVYDYTLVVLSGADIVALEMHQSCTLIHGYVMRFVVVHCLRS